jgi:UDP-N-acetylmuramoyl-L-alanyl-D-glutamate--2,6-diaminopimelate ligase
MPSTTSSSESTASRPAPALDALLSGTRVLSVTGQLPGGILGMSCDSRSVKQGDLFFALPGSRENGVRFAHDAVERGAVAVVSGEEIPDLRVPIVRVPDARGAMADLAAAFHGFPSTSLAVAGVTGTNGKTTTAWIIRHLCEAVGRSCGLIGTIEYILPGVVEPASRTTPESIDLQRMLAGMRDGGFRAASLEVSSHSLVQQRVRGIEFDAAVFTNLTQDHLDYHGTMEEYFEAKSLLFSMLASQTRKKGRAVINADDRYGHRLLARVTRVPVITYGQGSNCAFRASNIRHAVTGATFRLDAKGRSYLVRTPLIGLFNVYNVLAALAAVSAMGVELRRAVAAMAGIPQVPGRLERVPGRRNFQAYVDYAHTPDALENVLRSLRQLDPARIITVFGCGGDRDRSKRPLMAAAAERHSDLVILTSDNPRGEDPLAIIAEASRGFRGTRHESHADRAGAIRRAVALAGPGDIVLIAGKGHEDYQETAAGRLPFDDVQVTARAMAEKPTAEKR